MVEKKIKGRKRHITVDTMGNMLGVAVHAANLHDTTTGILPAFATMVYFPGIKKFCGDAGYNGTFVEEIKENFGLDVDIPEKVEAEGWHVLPKRWIVERTFSWLNSSRRLSKDYEQKTYSSESMIKLSHIHTLLKRM